jgi:hypothetical protein
MTIAGNGFAAFRGQVDREVFASGFDLWLRLEKPVQRLWRAVIKLPDRGADASPDDIPPEFFHFPNP